MKKKHQKKRTVDRKMAENITSSPNTLGCSLQLASAQTWAPIVIKGSDGGLSTTRPDTTRRNTTGSIHESVQDILAELFEKIDTLAIKDVKQMKSRVK